MSIFDKPMAADGLNSYRYKKTNGGYIMIGATSDLDALTQVKQSIKLGEFDYYKGITMENLQKWDGNTYKNINA